MPSERQQMVAGALWKTLIMVYTDPDDRSGNAPPVPVREACGALLTCLANLLAQTPDAKERQRIQQMISPALDRAIADQRAHEGGLVLPDTGIELPH